MILVIVRCDDFLLRYIWLEPPIQSCYTTRSPGLVVIRVIPYTLNQATLNN